MDNKLPTTPDDMSAFEDRLRAIEPVAPSPGLKSNLAHSLELRQWYTQPTAVVLASLAAAACIAFAVFLWPTTPHSPIPDDEITGRLPLPVELDQVPAPVGNSSATSMTLLAYYQALRESPDALDTVFDSQTVPTNHRGSVHTHPLTVMDAKMFLHENERSDG